jgi:hypothetical protein
MSAFAGHVWSGPLQWVHKHNLSTPWSTHERMPHQATWLYNMVVTGEEVTLAISEGGKDSCISCSFKLVGDDDKSHMLCSSEH